MKLIELLTNKDVEIEFAGVCECGQRKYDVSLNGLYYGIVHGDVVAEHCHEFQKDIKTKRPKF